MASYRLALLGDPVEHSRSPRIHRVLFDLSGLDGDYTTLRAGRAELATAIADLREGSWSGLNVTMPLKGDAADLADVLSPEAGRSSSVNTLVLTGGSVVGHSTDATTFAALLADRRFAGDGLVHLLGAGGSAAALLAAASADCDLYISARRPEKAIGLVERMSSRSDGAWPADRVTQLPWGSAVAGALVVNTTPLGMRGEPLPDGLLERARGLIDLPYGEEPTPSVVTANERGIPFVDGHEFLLRQAIGSFAIWTGVEPSYETVVERLRKP